MFLFLVVSIFFFCYNMQHSKKKKHKRTRRKRTLRVKVKLKVLPVGFPLYAAKKDYGDKILQYTKKQESKYKDSCLYGNMSWFGDLEQAQQYKNADNFIFNWTVQSPTHLLSICPANESTILKWFQTTNKVLQPAIQVTTEKAMDEYEHPFLQMNQKERALYEFRFAFGYMTLHEQYQFMLLIQWLIEHHYIEMKTRGGKSVVNKLSLRINYYALFNKITSHTNKYNRISLYEIDKHALNNLCKVVPSTIRIDGIYQPNKNSFWFPDLIVYHFNIKEYVLFNPHHCLQYVQRL